MRHSPLSRRTFLQQSAAVAGAAVLGPVLRAPAAPGARATDQVILGGTGIRMSRLGMGTGSQGGRTQHALGQETFTKLVRYAYDQGITYFDCAQNYRTFDWMGDALKDFPRKDITILSKIPGNPENPDEVIDNHLRTFKTDYLDCVLCHCATKGTWTSDRQRVMEAMIRAKEKGKIRAVGVSCHTLPALEVAAREDWVQVNLVRVNPQAKFTDGADPKMGAKSAGIAPVMKQIGIMQQNKHGVIGMKLIGNGTFTKPEDREKSIRFAMQKSTVHAATIGFKNPAEIDEAIGRIDRALVARPAAQTT